MKLEDLVYEVPESKLSLDQEDIKFLESIKEKYKDDVSNIFPHTNYVMKSGYAHWFMRNGTQEEKAHPIFKKFLNLFKNTSHNSLEKIVDASKLARIPGPLNIHTDIRPAILSIPLVELKKPLTFWTSRNDDKKIIEQYYYTKYQPVIKNVHVEHNVIDNDEDRIMFQIGAFGIEQGEDFKYIISKL